MHREIPRYLKKRITSFKAQNFGCLLKTLDRSRRLCGIGFSTSSKQWEHCCEEGPLPVLQLCRRTVQIHTHQGISRCVKSSALAQLMSRPTWNCHSHGEHSCLITIGGSPNAPGSVRTRWDLLLASSSMHVSVQPHLRVRTAHAPTEDNITYIHCIILLSLNTHSDLL